MFSHGQIDVVCKDSKQKKSLKENLVIRTVGYQSLIKDPSAEKC